MQKVSQVTQLTYRQKRRYHQKKFLQNLYSVLYEGLANEMINYNLNDFQSIYSLSTQDITFALTAKGKESVYRYTVLRTEHPKLLIFETTKGD